jgi:hypothetical protein
MSVLRILENRFPSLHSGKTWKSASNFTFSHNFLASEVGARVPGSACSASHLQCAVVRLCVTATVGPEDVSAALTA